MIWSMTGEVATETSAARKIEGFRDLPDGWHYGQGGPVSDKAISDALDIHYAMLGLGWTLTNAFAGANREILLTAYHGPHYVAVIVEPDGSFSLSHEEGDTARRDLDRVSMIEVKKSLREISREIWHTFVSSTRGTSITSVANSTIWPSKTLQPA